MEENTSNQTTETPKRKKNFWLRHLWDFVLLGTLALGTSGFFIARAIQNSQTKTANIKATVLLEGTAMVIPGPTGANRNPFLLNTIDSYEEIEIQGKHTSLVLGLKKNSIAIVRSGCPGQECVHEGWVSTANHPIVCAHNGVFIEVTSSDWGEIIVG